MGLKVRTSSFSILVSLFLSLLSSSIWQHSNCFILFSILSCWLYTRWSIALVLIVFSPDIITVSLCARACARSPSLPSPAVAPLLVYSCTAVMVSSISSCSFASFSLMFMLDMWSLQFLTGVPKKSSLSPSQFLLDPGTALGRSLSFGRAIFFLT
ncbi:uncharacterized protein EV420DRAFT_1544215 [Desarmillaria tabescens]|uniref:Uncharacterized protein n=1 Tax=Armillaria tabescens TaxID=1929756 RepID=A0AA39KEA9_ARMTA|nr:uncharacterized protein EV420DRAFT_1544215 [Desarmillaria tabescens]KAK0458214.1 hypothetical protein EV420DRAFT_1544215 [Desarmillaria tabescens]